MKKLLLIAATSATILSSSVSFAEGMDNEWYLRIDAGAAMFNKEKDKATGVKLKSNTTVPVDLGIGYYISENFRADLTLGTIIIGGKLKKSGAATNAPFTGTNVSASHKPTITRLLINGYVDLTNFDMFDVFAGVGVGPALVKEKITYNGITGLSSNTKNRTNISYKLTLGTSAQIADGVKAELAYSWIDDGRTKSKNVIYQGTSVPTGGMRYQSHNLTAGIRFDI